MALNAERLVKASTGFRIEQLAAAFDRLIHPRDWQAPIRALISVAERELVEESVRWFTGAAPAFEPVPGAPDQLLVTAPGFRLGMRAAALPELPRMSFQETVPGVTS